MESIQQQPRQSGMGKVGILIALCLAVTVIGLALYFAVIRDSKEPSLLDREISRLEEVVKQRPGDTDAWVELALLRAEGGSYGRAIADLEEVLALNGDHQGALVGLGDIYMIMGRYEEAITPYGRVADLIKDSPMHGVSMPLEAAFYNLGFAYLSLDRPEDAVEPLEAALAIDRTDADAWYVLGDAHQRLGNCDKATASFAQAVRFAPEFIEAYEGLAQCYEVLGETELALYAEAMIVYISGPIDEAIAQLEEVVSAAPDLARAFLGLGLAYEKGDQGEKAIEAYQSALRLEPDMWLANAKLVALGVR